MHWFDQIAKGLASYPMSRRAMLIGTGALAGAVLADRAKAAVVPSNPLTGPHPSPLRGVHGVPPSHGIRPRLPLKRTSPVIQRYGPCTFETAGNQRTLSFASTGTMLGGLASLSFQQATHVTPATARGSAPTGSFSNTIEVRRAGLLFMRIVSSTVPVPLRKGMRVTGTINVTYGPDFRDLRSAQFSFSGSSVTGTVNGRGIVPFQASTGETQASIKFTDGKPAPAGLTDPKLLQAMRQFAMKVQADVQSCGRLPARSVTSATTTAGVASQPEIADGTQLAWNPPAYLADWGPLTNATLLASLDRITPIYTFGRSGSCDGCNKGCDVSFGICVGAAAFLCPPCIAGCYGEYATCWAGCFVPGGGCCSTFCQAFSCCDSNETCCGGYDGMCCTSDETCTVVPRGALCCKNDYPVGCGDKYSNAWQCCKPGSTCCGEPYAYCCDQGYTCCGSHDSKNPVCCPPEASVCLDPVNGLCCAQQNICGKECCSSGQTCYTNSKGEGVCCYSALCGDQCCVSGQLCNQSTGQCGYGQVCGDTFCGFGYTCVNNQCVPSGPSPANCKPPLVSCPYTSICCDTNNPDATKKQICCGTVCCNALTQDCCHAGQCCPRGSIH